MKKISRMTAILIAAAMVLTGSLVKARITFSSLEKKLETQFMEGTDRDGLSIASDMEIKLNVLKNTLTIADRMENLDNKKIEDARQAAEQFQNCESYNALNEMEQLLDASFDALTQDLKQADLKEKDRNYVLGFIDDYHAADHRISQDPYHDMMEKTEKKTSGALAKLLMKITFSHSDHYHAGGH